MAFSDFTGPIIVFGRGRSGGGVGFSQEYNPDSPAPSLFEYMVGLLDTRVPFVYQPGQSATRPFYGYLGGCVTALDAAPAVLAADNIAAAAHTTAGTAMTLVSTTGAGITVGASVVNALTGVTATGLLAIDGASGSVGMGAAASMQLWDPTKLISRAVSVTSTANFSAVVFTVAGYDCYGYPMTEAITGPNNGTSVGKKAFKYITSVTPGTTVASNVSIGTGDVFGIPLRADAFAYVDVYWNDTLITASTGFVAADATDPATTTTGDVRGTYAVQSAADGTKRLQIFWKPKVANISLGAPGLWGVLQN